MAAQRAHGIRLGIPSLGAKKMPCCGVIPFDRSWQRKRGVIVLKTITRLAAAAAALAAGLCSGVPPSRAAAGSAPWCIVTDEGNTHCNYSSSQECLQAIAGGERGFCNVNSTGSLSSVTAAPPEHRKRRSQ